MYAGVYCGAAGVGVAVLGGQYSWPWRDYVAFGPWAPSVRGRLGRVAGVVRWTVRWLEARGAPELVAVAGYPEECGRAQLVTAVEVGLLLHAELLRRRWEVVEVPAARAGHVRPGRTGTEAGAAALAWYAQAVRVRGSAHA